MYYIEKNDELYHVIKDQNELYHHGVKGQKWGVHRTPEQLGRRKAINKVKEKAKEKAKVLGKSMARTISSAGHKAKTVAVKSYTAGANKIRESLDEYTDYIKQDGEIENLRELSKTTKKETPNEAAKVVNKACRAYSGGDVNGASCAMAIDMRTKGYDVRSRGQKNGLTDEEIEKMYKGGKMKKIEVPKHFSARKTYKTVYDSLSKDNEGNSSGLLSMTWFGSTGGHTLYYESNKGKVEFYDGQIGKMGKKLNKYWGNTEPSGFTYMRTDDKLPSEEITKCVVSADRKVQNNK